MSSGTAGGSGSNLSPKKAPISASPCRCDHEERKARPSVAIIEDNTSDVFLIKEAIAEQHLDVDLQIVDDGEKALRLIECLDREEGTPCPRLMLLDLNLPRTDGFEVLGRVRKSKRCANVPVIVMTSSDAPSDRGKSQALGANAYFQKPSQYREFLKIGDMIRRYLNESPVA